RKSRWRIDRAERNLRQYVCSKRQIDRKGARQTAPLACVDGKFWSAYAAFSVGKSTSSQIERPLHFPQRGKLASFSSSSSSPQHSEAYKPVSNTSCPVFIALTSNGCRSLSYMFASGGPLSCGRIVSYSVPRENPD